MYNNEELEIKALIDEAFCDLTEERRKSMMDELLNQEGNRTFFCVFNGDHIARIGARYVLDTGATVKIFFTTNYDESDWPFDD